MGPHADLTRPACRTTSDSRASPRTSVGFAEASRGYAKTRRGRSRSHRRRPEACGRHPKAPMGRPCNRVGRATQCVTLSPGVAAPTEGDGQNEKDDFSEHKARSDASSPSRLGSIVSATTVACILPRPRPVTPFPANFVESEPPAVPHHCRGRAPGSRDRPIPRATVRTTGRSATDRIGRTKA